MHLDMCIIYIIYVFKCLGFYAYKKAIQVFFVKNILDPSQS